MEFKTLFNIFDEDYELNDVLARIADEGSKARKFLNAHITSLEKSDGFQKANKVGENINELNADHSNVYFLAGFVIGQEFDVTNPEAQKEIKLIQKKVANVLGCWPRKKAPDRLWKGPGASSEQ